MSTFPTAAQAIRDLQAALAPAVRSISTLASAARTASGNSGDIALAGARQISVDVNVTAFGGATPTLELILERKAADGLYYTLVNLAGINTVRTVVWSVGEGMVTNHALTDTVRLRWVIAGTTPSFTFSASVSGR